LLGGRQFDVAPQQMPCLRIGDQVISQSERRPEHGEQPAAQAAVAGQCRIELVPVVTERLDQPDHRAQCSVGIRCARQ
jgi:hypothetical protein